MKSLIMSTDSAGGMLPLPLMAEPVPDLAESETPLYVGKTSLYKLPVFLDLRSLVNPHIAVVGATGTGKTYLLKSLLARFAIDGRHGIMVVDWNGEYSETIEALGGRVIECGTDGPKGKVWRSYLRSIAAQGGNSMVVSVCLAGIGGEPQRRDVAVRILRDIVAAMISAKPGSLTHTMLVVDEAWKLASRGGELSQLFRESRKYGFSIAIATQLTNDMDASILANAACRFVFKLTGADSAKGFEAAGLKKSEAIAGSLGVGSCIMSIASRGGSVLEFVVGAVDGFPLRTYLIEGANMNARVSNQRLEELIAKLSATEHTKSKLRELVANSRGTLYLAELANTMAKAGFTRADIVWFLREVGIDDVSIARACEAATQVQIGGGEFVEA